MQFWAILTDSFRQSVDRKIFWVLIGLSVLVTMAMLCVGFDEDRVQFFFGMWIHETDHFNPLSTAGRSAIVGSVVYMVLMFFLGWVGIILTIIATASFFPRMMEPGGIGVVLSKPIGRSRLFLYRYVSSMVFVMTQAVVFVGLTFLVMGLHWGIWVPGYLLSILLLILLFSYVYCVSVLVAVKTRSPTAAILLSMVAWMVFSAPNTTLQVMRDPGPHASMLYRGASVLYWVFPKTGHIPYLAARWAEAGTSLDTLPAGALDTESAADDAEIQHARDFEEKELRRSPFLSIGSSLLFEVAIVLWSMAVFRRKDF